jgi:hypothetical protein
MDNVALLVAFRQVVFLHPSISAAGVGSCNSPGRSGSYPTNVEGGVDIGLFTRCPIRYLGKDGGAKPATCQMKMRSVN